MMEAQLRRAKAVHLMMSAYLSKSFRWVEILRMKMLERRFW